MFRNKVFLSLGTNVGNWKVNFNHCLKELKKVSKLNAIGNIYFSKPYGFEDQNFFYNTCVNLYTNYSPLQLLQKIKIIEKKLYKNKIIQNGPRRIDVDIIFFNALKFSHENLVIPHPRASTRDFVLYPLSDINPFYFHPVEKKSIKKLITELQRRYIKKRITQPRGSFVIH